MLQEILERTDSSLEISWEKCHGVGFQWFHSCSGRLKPLREGKPAQIQKEKKAPNLRISARLCPICSTSSSNYFEERVVCAGVPLRYLGLRNIRPNPASTSRHLQHPLNRVHHLRGALCNLRGRAFERAALTYLQMALIRLACLFKHQKPPRQSVSLDWEKVTDRRGAIRAARAHFCYPARPSCNSSAEGKQRWRQRGQRDTN